MPGTNQLIAQLLGVSLLCQNWKTVTVFNDVTDIAGNHQGKTFGSATGCFRIFWTFWRTAA